MDCAIDCVGFEAVLNSIMDVTRAEESLGIPGLYVTGDSGSSNEDAKIGTLKVRLGLGWAKAHTFVTGQTTVMKYHRDLMMSILSGKAQIAKAVNATLISLDEAPEAYTAFDQGASKKFVIDPHSLVSK